MPTVSLTAAKRVRLVTEAGELTIQWRANRRHEPENFGEERWLTESQIAARTSLSEASLRQMRFAASGPPYLRDGQAVLYRLSMIKQWRSMQP
jgi:hypothetical protein